MFFGPVLDYEELKQANGIDNGDFDEYELIKFRKFLFDIRLKFYIQLLFPGAKKVTLIVRKANMFFSRFSHFQHSLFSYSLVSTNYGLGA